MRALWIGIAALAAGLAAGQPVLGPAVEIKGTIEKVQLARGEGMPFLEVKTSEGTRRVILGSMRYLMEKNFNPKAGAEVVVKGFRVNENVMAQSVTLPAANLTLPLRDEKGMPLWRHGHGSKGKGQD